MPGRLALPLSQPHLGIIVPAYNEQERIGPTLERIAAYLDTQPYQAVVAVVSDGSRDQTAEIVASFAQRDPRVRLIAYQPNRGKGHAVRRGMLQVPADWLLLCDADLATPIEEVEKLFAAQAPVAIGSRPLRESKLEVRQPLYREMLGRLFNVAVQVLGIRGIADTQCGFKLFRQDAAQQVFTRCLLDGFGFDFEALMIARDLGLPIAEIGVRWAHQEGSKVVLMRDGPRMLRDLVKLRMMGRAARLKLNPKPFHE